MGVKTKFKVGDKFNRLTIVRFSHQDNHHRNHFVVMCECGLEKIVQGSLMSSGNTKSCGCLSREVRKSKRISNNHSEITAIILGYKRHAEDRGFVWGLSRRDVEDIVFKECFYCGCDPGNRKKTKNSIDDGLKYNGIDRVNSSFNYTLDNVVPCCKICNYAKSTMDIEEFRKWAISIGKKAMAEQWGKLM